VIGSDTVFRKIQCQALADPNKELDFGKNKIPIIGWRLVSQGAVNGWNNGDVFWGNLGKYVDGGMW